MKEIIINKSKTIPMQLWIASLKRDKSISEGKVIMNELNNIAPHLYEIIVWSKYDCTYDDSKIPDLIEYLVEICNED